jgi:ribosomal protein L32
MDQKFGRCKNCGQLYEKNLSHHVCDDCYPNCYSYEPIIAKPKEDL